MSDKLHEERTNHKPLNILLVEDNEADIKITLRAFRQVSPESTVYVVQDGEEALHFIYHQGKYEDREKFPTPDLILLDINLPKLDGFQVLKRLKGDLEYNFIPVIMLTSSTQEEDVVKSYTQAAASFVTKPVNYADFVKIVEGFIFYWNTVNRLPDRRPGM